MEAIPGIVPLVERLRDLGATYELDGDIYFSVEADPHFGKVSNLDAAAMKLLSAERGGDPERPGKKNPVDPMLWMAAREGEPSWDGGSLGRGRPGWHIECVAIALDHLGMGFDVQGGGSDLVFPHHEMGASHAQALTGEFPMATAYVHAGMVALHGEKMSKSKGTWSSSPGCAATAWTRRRSGWRCSPTTTAPTGSGPTRSSRTRGPVSVTGARRSPAPTARPPRRWSRRSARPCPTT
ncbi:hypothetical protein SHKM778_65190 [Streptomyces sp. KM77-8]|uniref:tRNA synthetases class I catalytic domain-containing protein n=1 Tax=Streptomyces haneummycinicus TaxID=3074435 RepID=A0AAT9HS45_9ACTN